MFLEVFFDGGRFDNFGGIPSFGFLVTKLFATLPFNSSLLTWMRKIISRNDRDLFWKIRGGFAILFICEAVSTCKH